MFSCFTKCCAKRKNSVTNHPIKKINDSIMQDILRELIYVPDYKSYEVVSEMLSNLKGLEAFKKSINDDCTQNVSSVQKFPTN